MQNFSSLASTQADLDKFLSFFQEIFRNFLKKIRNFGKKIGVKLLKRQLSPKFEPSSFFYQNFKNIFNFFQNLMEFKNLEFEVHQVGPKDLGSQTSAYNTVELASI
jgi:hypothetical protein